MFLDIGGEPLDFWDLTVLEIRDMIESYNRVAIQKQKEKIIKILQTFADDSKQYILVAFKRCQTT